MESREGVKNRAFDFPGTSSTLIKTALILILFGHQGRAAQRYPASGLAISVDRARQILTISHESIPHYMDAMTMPFRVRDPKLLNGVSPGVRVDFTLVVDTNSSWIEQVRVVPFLSTDRDPDQARRLALAQSILNGRNQVPILAVGQAVPDFTLIDQNNKSVSLKHFAGKVVAINFVYTRCPLPDYCFRLSNNLSQVRKRFSERIGRDLELITITFDPAHDTPETMAKYAHIWNADAASWHFLTGPPADVQRVCDYFGVAAWQDEGTLTHSLHTVVIGRGGRLAANLEGNKFTAKQLGDLVESVLKRPN
jgi:protein SCO1